MYRKSLVRVGRCTYLVALRALAALVRTLSDTDEFQRDLLLWVANYPRFFAGVRPTIAQLEKRFSATTLPDGTERPGRSRTAIEHHVNALVARGLMNREGSVVWCTARGLDEAAATSVR